MHETKNTDVVHNTTTSHAGVLAMMRMPVLARPGVWYACGGTCEAPVNEQVVGAILRAIRLDEAKTLGTNSPTQVAPDSV